MLGNHDECDKELYCKDKHRDRLIKVDIDPDNVLTMDRYMKNIADRQPRLKKGKTSNLVEGFFGLNCKY